MLVLSDECYAEFTWSQPPTTILTSGTQGVLAVHSLSKRDNFAGARIGFYSGDADVVHYLEEVRKHAGLMPPGPVQAAAVDRAGRRRARRGAARSLPPPAGAAARDPGRRRATTASCPAGAFYLWVPAADAWAAAADLAERAGIVVSPGDFYGSESDRFFRVAAVQPDDRIELAADRIGLRT